MFSDLCAVKQTKLFDRILLLVSRSHFGSLRYHLWLFTLALLVFFWTFARSPAKAKVLNYVQQKDETTHFSLYTTRIHLFYFYYYITIIIIVIIIITNFTLHVHIHQLSIHTLTNCQLSTYTSINHQ